MILTKEEIGQWKMKRRFTLLASVLCEWNGISFAAQYMLGLYKQSVKAR